MDPGNNPISRKDSESNTFELEEHKLSEIIKSSEKHFDEHAPPFDSPSKDATPCSLNFRKKELSRQNLKANIFPESGGASSKNLWSTKQENSMSIQNFMELCQNTHSRGALMQSDSSMQPEQAREKSKLGKTLKEQLSRRSRKQLFGSALKIKPKSKLFSMRKRAKLSQKASAKLLHQGDSKMRKLPSVDSQLLSHSQPNSNLQQKTRFHIQRAKLSKEDFNFSKPQLEKMFEGWAKSGSKKMVLEKKLALKTCGPRPYIQKPPTNQRRQNSIFEETKDKFEQNLSNSRAANILHKIVSKDKLPVSNLQVQLRKKKSQEISKKNQSIRRRMKVTRARTGEFPEEHSNAPSESYANGPCRQNSLDLSGSLEFKSRVNRPQCKKAARFYYKKSLKKKMYNNPEAQENKTYQSIYLNKEEPYTSQPDPKQLVFDKPKLHKQRPGNLTTRPRSKFNNSGSRLLGSRNFSKKMNQDENADLRQSSMSSNNSLYNNPGFVRVTQKMEQGKYLPYNYSEKKVICPKSSNAERGVPTQLTTSQFSKLYRRELNSSTSVKKKKRQLMESKEYRRNFCSNYKNGKKPKKKASFQLEEYLGSRPLNQNAKNPKTMNRFNTEYDYHDQHLTHSQLKSPYQTNTSKLARLLQLKKLNAKTKSLKNSVKKKKPRSTKKANLVSTSNSKKSKWIKQSNAQSNYEQWKRQKQARHVRKHSEQLFSTLKENQEHTNNLGTSRAWRKQSEKKRHKKLSIDISKNSIDQGGFSYHKG